MTDDDIMLFPEPGRQQGIETLADRYTITSGGDCSGRISWRQLQRVASDPSLKLAMLDGIRCCHVGHDLTDQWAMYGSRATGSALGLSRLERRVSGRVIEAAAWEEARRDEELTLQDIMTLWRRLGDAEPEWRRAKMGDISMTHDDGFWELLRQAGHQAFSSVLHLGRPVVYEAAGDEFLTGWQAKLDIRGSSRRCLGGVIDAVVCGHHHSQIVAVDIKSTDHSIAYGAQGRWNPKNQIQVLLYLSACALMHIADPECPVPLMTAAALVNPVRGTIEYATSGALLEHLDVIMNLAERSFALSDEMADRLHDYLADALEHWVDIVGA